jgi:sulfate-transporting ATPase
MTAVLEAEGLRAGYGNVEIVRDIDLRVDEGEVVALLGPNGAGKTTTISTLSGELRALGGEVRFFGARTNAPLHVRARKGLGVVSQERAVLMDLTVRENLRVSRCDIDRALELFPELESHVERRVGLLSGGQQQMLALARVLIHKPEVLIIDELSLGLAPIVVQRMLELIDELRARGQTMVIVEQSLNIALAISDRAIFLEKGEVKFEGAAADLMARDDLARAVFFGDEGG